LILVEYVENEKHRRRVIEDIIVGAKSRLDIATANVKALTVVRGKRGVSIVDFFLKKAEQGLNIRILHSGVPSEYFLRKAAERELSHSENFCMRRCPRVHQKTYLADGKLLYLGSANLTGAGIGAKSENRRNFEVGIITDERALIDKVDSLFELIWCGDMCAKCARKASCPVPLEELKS